uniref:Uncharacterized protein n=1 Tax=Geospiza parvula TaxID=87175 RepID=A0A8C3MYE3_GEOPR
MSLGTRQSTELSAGAFCSPCTVNYTVLWRAVCEPGWHSSSSGTRAAPRAAACPCGPGMAPGGDPSPLWALPRAGTAQGSSSGQGNCWDQSLPQRLPVKTVQNNRGGSQGSPGHSQGSPGHSQGCPEHSQGSPGHSQGCPGHSQGCPGHSQGCPGHSQGCPGHSQGCPGHSRGHQGCPGHSQGCPGHSQSSPGHSQGCPGTARDVLGSAAPSRVKIPNCQGEGAAGSHRQSWGWHSSPTAVGVPGKQEQCWAPLL